MEKKKRRKKLQVERGNCKGCEYRIRTTGGDGKGTCDFFLKTGKRRRTDSRGNCIENRKGRKKRGEINNKT